MRSAPQNETEWQPTLDFLDDEGNLTAAFRDYMVDHDFLPDLHWRGSQYHLCGSQYREDGKDETDGTRVLFIIPNRTTAGRLAGEGRDCFVQTNLKAWGAAHDFLRWKLSS